MERNYVPIVHDTCEWMWPIQAESTINGCGLYGSHYTTYISRLNILSGYVEMNPAPKSDENVEIILNDIKQNNDGILEDTHEVKGIRDEVFMV